MLTMKHKPQLSRPLNTKEKRITFRVNTQIINTGPLEVTFNKTTSDKVRLPKVQQVQNRGGETKRVDNTIRRIRKRRKIHKISKKIRKSRKRYK